MTKKNVLVRFEWYRLFSNPIINTAAFHQFLRVGFHGELF